MKTAMRFGKWTLEYDPPPIPVRELDYVAVHDDFDGAPTYSDGPCMDRRCVRGSSVRDVLEQINDLELDDEPEWALCSCQTVYSAAEGCQSISCDRNADREER